MGSFGTICATMPSEELRELETLRAFLSRIELLGWSSRIQFEEFWMSLLGVLSIVQSEESTGEESADELNERTQVACLAVAGITSLLGQTLLVPKAGNPLISSYTPIKNARAATFLHTKYGERLQIARRSLKRALLQEDEHLKKRFNNRA